MHPSSYLPRGDLREPSGGWRAVRRRQVDGWIGLYPPTLREVLKDNGHLMAPLLQRWMEDGTLVTNRGHQLEVTVGGERHRVYAFRRDRLV